MTLKERFNGAMFSTGASNGPAVAGIPDPLAVAEGAGVLPSLLVETGSTCGEVDEGEDSTVNRTAMVLIRSSVKNTIKPLYVPAPSWLPLASTIVATSALACN